MVSEKSLAKNILKDLPEEKNCYHFLSVYYCLITQFARPASFVVFFFLVSEFGNELKMKNTSFSPSTSPHISKIF